MNAPPPIMTGQQLAEFLQVPHCEKHLTALRHDGGLPHIRLRQGKEWFFRYPTSAVLEWVESRTHRGPGGKK